MGDAGARHAQNRAGKRGEDARGPRVRGGRARVFALAQAREADIAPAPTATPPPPPAEPAPNSEPRKYRAGLAAEIAKKRAIGVAGVTGGSQKKLKKLLKKKRAAGLA